MIRHCVFLRLRADHDGSELQRVMSGLRDLTARLEGASEFRGGANIDVEGKSPGVPAGFTIDFTDRMALKRYAEDPSHRDLGARLVALCEGGGAGIVVYDIEDET